MKKKILRERIVPLSFYQSSSKIVCMKILMFEDGSTLEYKMFENNYRPKWERYIANICAGDSVVIDECYNEITEIEFADGPTVCKKDFSPLYTRR